MNETTKLISEHLIEARKRLRYAKNADSDASASAEALIAIGETLIALTMATLATAGSASGATS